MGSRNASATPHNQPVKQGRALFSWSPVSCRIGAFSPRWRTGFLSAAERFGQKERQGPPRRPGVRGFWRERNSHFRRPPKLFVGRQNHGLHVLDAVVGEEHMLGAAPKSVPVSRATIFDGRKS